MNLSFNLPLDGIHRLNNITRYHFFENNDEPLRKKHCLHQQVLLRLTIFAHTAFSIIYSVNLHLLRAISSILLGVFTLDHRKIIVGFKDLLALVIEAVALPLIGISIFFVPELGLEMMPKILKHHQTIEENYEAKNSKKINMICHVIIGIVRAIFALPIGLIVSTSNILSGTLMADRELIRGGWKTLAASFAVPFLGIVASCNKKIFLYIHHFHYITIK